MSDNCFRNVSWKTAYENNNFLIYHFCVKPHFGPMGACCCKRRAQPDQGEQPRTPWAGIEDFRAYRWFLTGPKKPHLWQRVWMRFALQIIGRIWTDLLSSPIEVDTRAQIFKSASPLVSGLRRLEMPMVPLSPSATASLTCTKAAAWVSETMRWLKEKRSGVQKKQLYTC